ncbi:MAG: hypothetical protein OJF52_003243 [Nitrospira sp.]|nr:MAG: hypothetical protein OJF52_003243 [Nitrospira sp.]
MYPFGYTSPFDMSGERMTPLGPEWGVVIGLYISTACERMRYKG